MDLDRKRLEPKNRGRMNNSNNQKASIEASGVGKRKTWKSDGNERIPVQISRGRSELSDSVDGDGIKKAPIGMKKARPEWNKMQTALIEKVKAIGTKEPLIGDECGNVNEGGNRGDEITKSRSDCSQMLDELSVCEEKLIAVDLEKVKSLDVINPTVEENEERAIVLVPEPEPELELEPVSKTSKSKSSDVVISDKIIPHRNERSNLVSRTVRKQLPPVVNHPRTTSKPNEERVPKSHSKLQSLIDLIMWKDASKSALVFGFGTFSILSSSYTQDLHFSFISVISYFSLIYLAAIFIFKSFISRSIQDDDNEYVVGEEEAIWALKIFLPYINEFLLKVKALFSGDPATTMKMAVLLFILARCGSSITIWKMAKLAFFGVFTVPKICSSYSSQLSAYGTFWIRRFKDAWDSCSQKKAVAFGVFTLVWNLSSIVARIWAVFVLLVAFKYYQQSIMTKEDEVVEEEEPITHRNHSSWQEQRNGRTFASTEGTKLKKRS